MRRAITVRGTLGVLLLILVPAAPHVLAADPGVEAAGHPLVGSWLIDALPEVEGNPPAITSFHADGSVSEVGGRGEVEAGTWQPTSARGADATIVAQSRDGDGGYLGLQIIRASIEVSGDDALSGTWTLELPAAMTERAGLPPGQLGPGEVSGQRIEVEPPGETVAPIPAGPPPTGTEDDASLLELYMRGTDQVMDLTTPPRAGQSNIIGSDLYRLAGTGESPEPTGSSIGRRVAVCTVVTDGEAICDGMLHVDGRGTISAQLEVLIPGGNQGIAITGGTGEFAGATGTITERQVPGHPGDRVLEVRIK